MIKDVFDIFMQYAVYALWVGLFIVLLLIANNRYKAHQRAKHAKRNPEIRLFPYEYPTAKGEITFFFEADEPLEYHFFVHNTASGEKLILAEGKCRKGGQKIQFDTTKVVNGHYYYGLATHFQKTEKRLEINN